MARPLYTWIWSMTRSLSYDPVIESVLGLWVAEAHRRRADDSDARTFDTPIESYKGVDPTMVATLSTGTIVQMVRSGGMVIVRATSSRLVPWLLRGALLSPEDRPRAFFIEWGNELIPCLAISGITLVMREGNGVGVLLSTPALDPYAGGLAGEDAREAIREAEEGRSDWEVFSGLPVSRISRYNYMLAR